jgi:hypothetical protein
MFQRTQKVIIVDYCEGLYNFKITHISYINPLNAKLNPICHLLALLGAHHILHVSRIRVNIIVNFKIIKFVKKSVKIVRRVIKRRKV